MESSFTTILLPEQCQTYDTMESKSAAFSFWMLKTVGKTPYFSLCSVCQTIVPVSFDIHLISPNPQDLLNLEAWYLLLADAHSDLIITLLHTLQASNKMHVEV